nr:sodium-dependent bicarbonate transport family permease [Halomonas socia]
MTLYLVMMELPAIMVAIALYRRYKGSDSSEALQGIWHETLTNRGVILGIPLYHGLIQLVSS